MTSPRLRITRLCAAIAFILFAIGALAGFKPTMISTSPVAFVACGLAVLMIPVAFGDW